VREYPLSMASGAASRHPQPVTVGIFKTALPPS
jgi:hypothetical protein